MRFTLIKIFVISFVLGSFVKTIEIDGVHKFLELLKTKIKPTDSFNDALQIMIKEIGSLGNDLQQQLYMTEFLSTKDTENPYYRFIPIYAGSVQPGQSNLQFKGICFQDVQVSSTLDNQKNVNVELKVGKPKSFLCSDTFFIATMTQFKLSYHLWSGSSTLKFNFPTKESEQYDLQQVGIRVFNFVADPAKLLKYLIHTVGLLAPMATQPVFSLFADLNRDFLKKYSGIDMQPRKITEVDIDENLIQSGDFFAIIRLDGLDPLISWAMGSNIGHTTVAIRRNGTLMVCESQAKGSYWPINGVQCNKYKDWIQMAKKADFNVLWVPLSDENRKKFNETSANKFVDFMYGIDYGYESMLMGWIDTVKDNYPCLPDNKDLCLSKELVDVVFSNLIPYVPVAGRVWVQAQNQRVGQQGGDKLVDIHYAAHKMNITYKQLPTIVEKDAWLYNTTRNGQPLQHRIMVCHVFVCNIWKEAGIFSKEFECTEFSVWDIYRLNIFQKNFTRPSQCVQADPENPLCQILGKYTLRLDNGPAKGQTYNYQEPYNHMSENCPSMAPDYVIPQNC